MAIRYRIRERQKNHLLSLLRIKAKNPELAIEGLQEEVIAAIAPMVQGDIAWIEKLAGVKAIEQEVIKC